jgi:hypothetical protein
MRLKEISQWLLVAGSAAPCIAIAGELPKDWGAFQSSTAAADVAVVKRISKLQWWQVCQLWGQSVRAVKDERLRVATREYLISERLINGKDLGHAGDRTVDIGMTTCGVFAALGRPHTVNQTTTATSHHMQMVYGRLYVYTDGDSANGLVTAIQR